MALVHTGRWNEFELLRTFCLSRLALEVLESVIDSQGIYRQADACVGMLITSQIRSRGTFLRTLPFLSTFSVSFSVSFSVFFFSFRRSPPKSKIPSSSNASAK